MTATARNTPSLPIVLAESSGFNLLVGEGQLVLSVFDAELPVHCATKDIIPADLVGM